MSRKKYRACLIMAIAAAVISGVCYYQFLRNKKAAPEDGTLVWHEMVESGFA